MPDPPAADEPPDADELPLDADEPPEADELPLDADEPPDADEPLDAPELPEEPEPLAGAALPDPVADPVADASGFSDAAVPEDVVELPDVLDAALLVPGTAAAAAVPLATAALDALAGLGSDAVAEGEDPPPHAASEDKKMQIAA